jgi:hypothetical protein
MQLTGIALSRLAHDAEFAITRVDKQVDHNPDPTFSPTTHHKLVDGHTIDEVMNIFHDAVGFDEKLEDDRFQVSLPISFSLEQWRAFSRACHDRLCHHLAAWITLYTRNTSHWKRIVDILFIDLTPGQIASQVVKAMRDSHGWTWVNIGTMTLLNRDVDSLNIDDVYERFFRPTTMSPNIELQYIVVLRPEGTFPNISARDLETKFPNLCVECVTLDDISRGAALMMESRRTMDDRRLPIEIALVNGKLVIAMLKHTDLTKYRGSSFFTTSRDNQTTVTVELSRGPFPWATLTLEGMIPKPRGEAVLKVTFQLSRVDARIVVEEMDTGLKSSKILGGIIWPPELDTYTDYTGQVKMMFGKGGIMGELPV